jgi:hypothetical protein
MDYRLKTLRFKSVRNGTIAQKNIFSSECSVILEDAASSVPTFSLCLRLFVPLCYALLALSLLLAFYLCTFALGFLSRILSFFHPYILPLCSFAPLAFLCVFVSSCLCVRLFCFLLFNLCVFALGFSLFLTFNLQLLTIFPNIVVNIRSSCHPQNPLQYNQHLNTL